MFAFFRDDIAAGKYCMRVNYYFCVGCKWSTGGHTARTHIRAKARTLLLTRDGGVCTLRRPCVWVGARRAQHTPRSKSRENPRNIFSWSRCVLTRAHTHTHTHGDNSSLHAVGRSEGRANVKTESKRFKLDPLFSYFKEHIWRIGIQDISSTINVQLSALIFYFSITLFVRHPMV